MQRPDLEQRLAAVLNDYQTLANSDPHKLRSLIPPTEVWRLFVESYRQNQNVQLEKYLHLQNLTRGLGRTALKESLRFTSTHPSIVTREWDGLINYLKLTQADLDAIKLRDLINYNKGWFLFEVSEPGYIKGLYRAFQCIFETRETLDIDFILKVHQTATEGVQNTNWRLWEEYKRGGRIRERHAIQYGLSTTSASEDGIFEILHEWNNYASFRVLDYHIDQYTPARLRASSLPSEMQEWAEEVKEEFPEFYAEIYSAINNRELAQALFKFVCKEYDEKLYYVSRQKGDVRANLRNDVNEVITLYNTLKSAAATPMEKLSAIAHLKTIERIHMLDDANCRTVCMITPNNLLVNSGLPISFINDANCFDAKSHIEIVEALIEGMENTFELIRTGMLHGVRTVDLLALADKPNTIGATRKYFEEAVAIEERARRRLPLPVIPRLKRAREDEMPDEHPSQLKRMRYMS